MDNELPIIYENLIKAQSPEEIFGTLESADQTKELKHQFNYLLRQVHPDHHDKDPKAKHIAEEATRALLEFYSTAQELISKGTYGSSKRVSASNDVEMTFNVGDSEYRIFSGSVEGDFCQVYFGECDHNGKLESICLKVAKDAEDNELLINEAKILRGIYHKSLPLYLASFEIEDNKRVNVLRRIEESYDLHTLREHFPDGLPQEHTVWVLDRLLSVLGYLHTNNIIHGAIEPSNILITPHNHNGILIDFLLSIPEAHQKTAQYVGVNEFSAPEIEDGAKPHPTADIYSLGKSMVYLLGGKGNRFPSGLDSRIVRFVQGFIREDPNERKNDAWITWHELKDLRTKVFGAPNQFLELKL